MAGAATCQTSTDRETFTDDELTTLALAADPDVEVAKDALCLWDLISPDGQGVTGGRGVLPEWYMPTPLTGARPPRRPWHRRVALLVIMSFLVIDGCGLCITYGQLVLA